MGDKKKRPKTKTKKKLEENKTTTQKIKVGSRIPKKSPPKRN